MIRCGKVAFLSAAHYNVPFVSITMLYWLAGAFFSPHSNRRTDRWGGDVNQRMTFTRAVIKEVRRVVNEETKRPFIVGYRFLPEELSKPGITIDDTLKLVEALSSQPIDYLHTSLLMVQHWLQWDGNYFVSRIGLRRSWLMMSRQQIIRYVLSPVNMDLLGLPGGLQTELRDGFLKAMNFSDQQTAGFRHRLSQRSALVVKEEMLCAKLII